MQQTLPSGRKPTRGHDDEFDLINLTIGSVEGADELASVDWAAGGFAFQVEVNSGDGFDPFDPWP